MLVIGNTTHSTYPAVDEDGNLLARLHGSFYPTVVIACRVDMHVVFVIMQVMMCSIARK